LSPSSWLGNSPPFPFPFSEAPRGSFVTETALCNYPSGKHPSLARFTPLESPFSSRDETFFRSSLSASELRFFPPFPWLIGSFRKERGCEALLRDPFQEEDPPPPPWKPPFFFSIEAPVDFMGPGRSFFFSPPFSLEGSVSPREDRISLASTEAHSFVHPASSTDPLSLLSGQRARAGLFVESPSFLRSARPPPLFFPEIFLVKAFFFPLNKRSLLKYSFLEPFLLERGLLPPRSL